VEGITCRLLPYTIGDGPHNMAVDETLLHSAVEGVASLRFYGWSPATLSLGYFQPEQVRFTDPALAALPFVRRPSGGDTLAHHHELTYALTLPAGAPWQPRSVSWLRRMHGVIAAALEQFGIASYLHESRSKQQFQGPLCFHHFTPGDLLIAGAKIAGSAQRKHRGALLQHGAILRARSAYTPSLPGIHELTGRGFETDTLVKAICQEFMQQTGWRLRPCDRTEHERELCIELVARKYSQETWNRKR
jgi:lipoyl(octanoyl) transferase